ncbi:hypothetical protein OHC33_008406 [Knufia fluminis]|uniref:Uncharacterized protein n=1 Tax=Knufia fluminis TaxID=191047 RepID=A0AAN8EAV5_9EURO|nr:hypothetical protein OHC33_008406 [Knufia fluminis]
MKYFVTFLVFAATSISSVKAQATGWDVANAACEGFPAGTLICLSDVSFANCKASGDSNAWGWVPTGMRCAQGIVGQVKDRLVSEIATTTRDYFLQSYGATTAPTAAA